MKENNIVKSFKHPPFFTTIRLNGLLEKWEKAKQNDKEDEFVSALIRLIGRWKEEWQLIYTGLVEEAEALSFISAEKEIEKQNKLTEENEELFYSLGKALNVA
jgi:predicted CopG family antitoxin